jgi:hypothetical protein
MIIVRTSWLKYLFALPGLYVLYVLGTQGRWNVAYQGIVISAFGYLAGFGIERLIQYLTARQQRKESVK